MKRAQILAEVLAHLEAERFAPVTPRPSPSPNLAPITAAQAEANRQALEDALTCDPVVLAWLEREAS
jgi:hypothetical protein